MAETLHVSTPPNIFRKNNILFLKLKSEFSLYWESKLHSMILSLNNLRLKLFLAIYLRVP